MVSNQKNVSGQKSVKLLVFICYLYDRKNSKTSDLYLSDLTESARLLIERLAY